MNSLDKAILDFINKASKRIKANFLINLSIVALKMLLCLIFSLLLISLFITIPYVEEISLGSVTFIGNYAFAYSYYVSTITIPTTVSIIGEYAFAGCQ